jgi:NitT/TauT family transport system permease protein
MSDIVLQPAPAPSKRRLGGRGTGRRVRFALLGLGGWITFVAAWVFSSEVLLTPFILPGPGTVVDAMWGILTSGELFEHFQWSLIKILVGFGCAVLLGLPIGYLMGSSRWWKSFFHLPVTVAGNVPGITYAVMALVIFGIAIEGPILAVALISMPYVALNVAGGVEGIDRDLVKMSEAFGRSKREIVRHVVIPTVVPFVFAGVRLSFAIAWKVEALTEVFGSSNGVGFMIRHSYDQFSVTDMLAWMFFFVLFMVLVERAILQPTERRLFRWRPTEGAAA